MCLNREIKLRLRSTGAIRTCRGGDLRCGHGSGLGRWRDKRTVHGPTVVAGRSGGSSFGRWCRPGNRSITAVVRRGEVLSGGVLGRRRGCVADGPTAAAAAAAGDGGRSRRRSRVVASDTAGHLNRSSAYNISI